MTAPSDVVENLKHAPLVAGVAALLCVLTGGWWLAQSGDLREVTRLEVNGQLRHVAPPAVAAAVASELARGFLAVDLDDARRQIERLPWVARARVERYWPAGVRICVWERQAVARWGNAQLLDSDSHSFTPAAADLPAELPMLDGPRGHEREVMETFERLRQVLSSSPFALAGLQLDARGEWSAQTRSGIALRLGRGAPEQQFDWLVGSAGTALAGRLDRVSYIDLRYTNGFAVGWKSQPAPVQGEAHG